MLRQIVQNIFVYVVMVNLLRGLAAGKGFQEIFRFVSGLILILLCLTPAVSEITDSNFLESILQGNLYAEDVAQLQQDAQLAEGDFEDVLEEECEAALEEQIRALADEDGEEAHGVEVSMKKNKDGALQICSVEVVLAKEAEQAMAQENGKIADIVIQNRDVSEEAQEKKKEDESAHKLQKQICDSLSLSEKKVIVWRKNGSNG